MSEKLTRLDLIKLYWLPDNPPTVRKLAKQINMSRWKLEQCFISHGVLRRCVTRDKFLDRVKLEMMLWPTIEEYESNSEIL